MEGRLRTITSIVAVLVMVLTLASSAFAQEEEYVELTFEVHTSGDVDSNTTFFALYGLPQSEFSAVQLQDQDGDGIYTGTAEWMVGGKQLVVALVQGTGTVESEFGIFPGEPVTTLREWREPMDITQDTTFEAGVAGTPSGMPSTGVGGMAGSTLTLVPLAAIALGIAAGAWALLRRS